MKNMFVIYDVNSQKFLPQNIVKKNSLKISSEENYLPYGKK